MSGILRFLRFHQALGDHEEDAHRCHVVDGVPRNVFVHRRQVECSCTLFTFDLFPAFTQGCLGAEDQASRSLGPAAVDEGQRWQDEVGPFLGLDDNLLLEGYAAAGQHRLDVMFV